MAPGPGWSAADVIASLKPDIWVGEAWRWHAAHRDPSSARGSEIVSGRYHRARAQDPVGPVWRAPYLGLTTGACLGEAIRYLGGAGAKATRGRRLTNLQVSLNRVLDLRDVGRLGLTPEDLTKDQDWSAPHAPAITQQLALAALQQGVEGLLVPAASLVDDNLVILIDNLSATSRIEIVSYIDPNLYVDLS
jgi:RES domain-containing protein